VRFSPGLALLLFIFSVSVTASIRIAPVTAESCSARIGYYPPPPSNYVSNLVLVVPVVATCSFAGSQLYAVGNLHDTVTNVDLGASRTILTAPYGGSRYGGQFVFVFSQIVQGHLLRISVSIYRDQQYSSQLTAVTQTTQIYPSSYYGHSPCFSCDYDYNLCQSSNGSTTQCSGFLYQAPNGCVEIVIPVNSPIAGQVYQYYALQNLPSTYPLAGSWVTVTGQFYHGYNTAPNGAACPGNYINVTSIS